MKRGTIIISNLAALLFAMSLVACGDMPTPPDMPGMGGPDGGENGVENYTPEIPIEENGYDGMLATDKGSDTVVSGDETYWENTEFSSTITIVYSKSSAEVTTSNSAIRSYVTGADVTLDLTDCGAVEIIASGATEDGQLKIYGNSAVKLTLNGAYIKSNKSAAINVQSKATHYLHLADGTENYICDAASQSDESYYPEGVAASDEKRNGALYCKGSLVVSGGGLLVLDGEKKHGISVKGSAIIRAGVTLAVNDVADNCIKAEGVTVLGGYIWAKHLQKQESASVRMRTLQSKAVC